MIRIRRSQERGHANYGWLDTHYSFSFAEYYDPQYMGFRALRVMNEDRIQPGRGFGMHGHQDMEIVTYVIEGSLEHKDSLGHGSVLRAGDLQRITAGKGIRHSEFNPSSTEAVHLYQIWLLPERPGLEPSYEERSARHLESGSKLRLVASRQPSSKSLLIHQDAAIYLGTLPAGESTSYELNERRHAWVQAVHGDMTVNDQTLSTGDGAAISDESKLVVSANSPAEFLLFDLA